MLRAAGYRVGTFTSPHLRHYRERIRLDDRLVSESELIDVFERIEAARMLPEELSLTFFEYNALAAFLIFEAARLDAWVLEVGLGGRLDAVNLVDATVAVVVSVAFDHQEYLGSTLESIAREKAGIFRPGRAAILGSRDPPPILESIAASLGARPRQLGRDFDYVRTGRRWRYVSGRRVLEYLPPPALAGDVQFANASTALAALEELEPQLSISADAVARALQAVRLVGRFQIITPASGNVAWILDVAHNPAAARVLADNLRASRPLGRTWAVCGILADKDATSIAAELRGCFDAWWLTTIEGARGASAAELAERMAPEIVSPVTLTSDIAAACAGASAAAMEGDRIVVFGSFHTVGPALDWLESQQASALGR
jgi:dihydrofolate synthase/folylpolyglutamate synthase